MHDSPGAMSTLTSLMHTAHRVQAHIEGKLDAAGLSFAKLAALTALREAGESMPLGQLAERLSCVKSNITQLVDRLEADGFVKRLADPRDRRTRLAVLTAAGRAACEQGQRLQAEAEAELVSALGAGESRELLSIVSKLQQRLE